MSQSKHSAQTEKTSGPNEALGFFDSDRVAKRRAFFAGIFDAIKNIDSGTLLGFIELLTGLFGGVIPGLSVSEEEAKEGRQIEAEIFGAMQARLPAATSIDPARLAQWVAFFKMIFALFSRPKTPAPAAMAIGDRLASIVAIGDFLAKLDTARINEIIAQMIALLKMIMSFFGVPEPPAANSLSADEAVRVNALWTPDKIAASAIDMAQIWVFIQMILQLIAMFKRPATPPTSPTGFEDAEGNPMRLATGV